MLFFPSVIHLVFWEVHHSYSIKGKWSMRLLWQNVPHRCRGGWLLCDVSRRKTCGMMSTGRCLSTPHHLFRWSCRAQAFHHTLLTPPCVGSLKRGCFVWAVRCHYSRLAQLTLRVDHAGRRGEQNYLLAQRWNTGALTKRVCPWWAV